MAAPRRHLAAAVVCAVMLVITGCSHDSGSRKAFCVQVAKVPPLSGVLAGYAQADPVELSRRLATTRAAYDHLRSDAPSSIEHETAAMVDLVDDVLDAVGEHRSDPDAVQAAIRATMADHADAGLGASKVVAYASDRCGVDLAPTVAPTTTE